MAGGLHGGGAAERHPPPLQHVEHKRAAQPLVPRAQGVPLLWSRGVHGLRVGGHVVPQGLLGAGPDVVPRPAAHRRHRRAGRSLHPAVWAHLLDAAVLHGAPQALRTDVQVVRPRLVSAPWPRPPRHPPQLSAPLRSSGGSPAARIPRLRDYSTAKPKKKARRSVVMCARGLAYR
ncbi:hypothetical protein FOCC_FOCC011344 [Frankliniella occidentalis]|nr:hypothetical protein FOCC_FOCC011344 [Frankliniella occidentalis]